MPRARRGNGNFKERSATTPRQTTNGFASGLHRSRLVAMEGAYTLGERRSWREAEGEVKGEVMGEDEGKGKRLYHVLEHTWGSDEGEY